MRDRWNPRSDSPPCGQFQAKDLAFRLQGRPMLIQAGVSSALVDKFSVSSLTRKSKPTRHLPRRLVLCFSVQRLQRRLAGFSTSLARLRAVLAVGMMGGMLTAFLLACRTGGSAGLELCFECGTTDVRSTADQHLSGGRTSRSAICIETDAITHRRHVVLRKAGIRTGGASQQTIETGLDAVFDSCGRFLGMLTQDFQTVIHNRTPC